MKNLMGLNSPKNNRIFHKKDWKTNPDSIAFMDQCIADLNTIIKPDLCIVGLPLTEDGAEQDASQAARRFANQLNGRYQLPVELVDERFTTREAQSLIQQSVMSKKDRQNKANIDKIAAQLILQSWLEHQ